MKRADPRLLRAALGLVALAGAAWGYHAFYASPRNSIQGDIDAARASIAAMERALESERDVARRERELGAATLGRREDIATNRFRIALARLFESQGLGEIVVETSAPRAARNPVADAKGVPSTLRRDLRADPGFSVLRGKVAGSGSYEQVMKTLAAAQSQDWAHRVEGFTIKPSNKERTTFRLSIDAATILAPAWAKDEGTEPVLAPVSPDAESAWRTLAARNPFVKPAPAAAAVARGDTTRPPGPRAPTLPPYEDWKVTGVTTGRSGLSVMLVNSRTGERLTLARGAAVLDATLVDAAGERAIFEIKGTRFEVSNGDTLAARRPQG